MQLNEKGKDGLGNVVGDLKNCHIIDNSIFVCSRSCFKACKLYSELLNHNACQHLNSKEGSFGGNSIKTVINLHEMIIVPTKY